MIGKEPCSITDDPLNDYSDWFDLTGVYKETPSIDDRADYEHDKSRDMDDNQPKDYESLSKGY